METIKSAAGKPTMIFQVGEQKPNSGAGGSAWAERLSVRFEWLAAAWSLNAIKLKRSSKVADAVSIPSPGALDDRHCPVRGDKQAGFATQ